MTINLDGDTAVFPDAQFFSSFILDQTADAYEEELRVYISALSAQPHFHLSTRESRTTDS